MNEIKIETNGKPRRKVAENDVKIFLSCNIIVTIMERKQLNEY